MDTMLRMGESTIIRLRQRLAALPHVTADTPADRPARLTPGQILLAVLWLIIGAVSTVDTYLTVKYRAVMSQTEQNPVGRFLIQQDGNDVSLFIGWKVAGTIACLGLLTAIALYARKAIVYPVFVAVAAAQLLLLWYLFS
jgi:hypothetical protein